VLALIIPVVASYNIGAVLPICALTSLALGPVKVNIPVVLEYVKLPSPPVSVTLKAVLTAILDTPVAAPTVTVVGVEVTATVLRVVSTLIVDVFAVTVISAI
jgi:hypothetical protein